MLAYGVRFESGLIPVTKGYPPIDQYLQVVPFVALLTPLAFQLQGVYRLRRGRSRVDDFFAVLIGSILAGLGVMTTLYFQAYYASGRRSRPAPTRFPPRWSGYSFSGQRRVYLRLPRGGPRAARDPLARGHWGSSGS